jgi:hypothetical protein
MKRYFLNFVFLLLTISIAAQSSTGEGESDEGKFYFNDVNIEKELGEIEMIEVDDHFLGTEIAKKFELIKDTYTYIERGSETSPGDKTVVQKPVIYYSLKKINRYYKKGLRKGYATEEEAKKMLNKVLDVAYAVFDQNTGKLEEAIKDARKPEPMLEVYNRVVLE